jgi:hypothetical protein
MNNLFLGPKNKTVPIFFLNDGFHNFQLSFCEEIQNKVSAYFYEITYRKPPVILKIFPKSCHECNVH